MLDFHSRPARRALSDALHRFIRSGISSQLRRNTVAAGVSSIVGGLISAVSYPIYLYFLGYEQYGTWLAVSIVLTFAAFGHLGLASAVATNVAEEYARGDGASVRMTVSTSLVTLTIIGLIALVVILSLRDPIVAAMRLRAPLAASARKLLPFAGVLSLYVVQIDTINSVLIGLGRIDLAVTIQQTGRLLSLLLSTTLLICGLGVFSLPIGSLVGYIFIHIVSLSLARRITAQACFRVSSFNLAHLRSLVKFGSGVLTSSIINLLVGPLNKFALTRYVGPASVTVYHMAYTLTMQIRGVIDAGLSSLMPEVSRLKALRTNEADARIRGVYVRAMKLIFGAGVPLFGCALLAASPALQLWLGPRFRPELVPSLRIMLCGAFASLIGVPGYYTLLGVRSVKHVVAANAFQAGLNAAILSWLAYAGLLSAVGASTATSVGIAAGGTYLVLSNEVARRSMAFAFQAHGG